MRTFSSYLRVLVIILLLFIAAEYFIDSGDKPAFIVYPEVSIFIGFMAIVIVGIEIMVSTMNRLVDAITTDEQKQVMAQRQAMREANAWYRKLYKSLTKAKPIAEESEIIIDHNYDGIRELDNSLPPWWLYGFYITIAISAVYLGYYHIFGGPGQAESYSMEVADAKKAIEEYKKTAKDLVDANTVVALTDPGDLAAGKTIFEVNCIACHLADGGGGIGPNLTDKNWILGGGIKNIFQTISEGGRSGKGMIAWKASLKPSEIQQVASYVLTFQGTNPANPKAAEGDIWIDETSVKESEIQEDIIVQDSLSISMNNP